MSYVHITRSPGLAMSEYGRIHGEIGPAPVAGLIGHHVGVVDGTLVVVDVWDTRADADRFAAERLFPAFERAGVHPDASVDITAFESATSGAPA
jgi:hypothetical protein